MEKLEQKKTPTEIMKEQLELLSKITVNEPLSAKEITMISLAMNEIYKSIPNAQRLN